MSGFQRGKRKRLSIEETRKTVIDAGRRLLLNRGLDAGLGMITLNDAILESGVPRASAYRVYQSEEIDPQDGFRAELISSYVNDVAAGPRTDEFEQVTLEVLATVDTSSPSSLSDGLREVIRLGSAASLEALLQDEDWRVVGPSMAVTSMAPSSPQSLVDAHRGFLDKSSGHCRSVLEPLTVICGLRLRRGMDWGDLGVLACFAPMMASFYWQHYPELHSIARPTGPGRAMQDWTHGGILLEGLILTGFEQDPDAPVSADLGRWLG